MRRICDWILPDKIPGERTGELLKPRRPTLAGNSARRKSSARKGERGFLTGGAAPTLDQTRKTMSSLDSASTLRTQHRWLLSLCLVDLLLGANVRCELFVTRSFVGVLHSIERFAIAPTGLD